MDDRFTILAECNTFESWTVDENGNPEEHWCNHEGVEPTLYYIDDQEGEFDTEYFDTYEEAQAHKEKLISLSSER